MWSQHLYLSIKASVGSNYIKNIETWAMDSTQECYCPLAGLYGMGIRVISEYLCEWWTQFPLLG